MDFNQIARELIPLLGGKENIASAAHCATRLRLCAGQPGARALQPDRRGQARHSGAGEGEFA